jgi:hypothetical protein
MEEAVKLSPRFLKRLMTFFHPFTHRFSDIERNKVSTKETPHVICNRRLSMAGKHALGEVGVHIANDAIGELRRAAFFILG